MSLPSALRLAAVLDRLRLRGCDRVGPGARLSGAPWVENAGRVTIGRGLHLSSRPVQSHLVVGPGGVLEIGDDVVVGHGAALAAHQLIRIGDGTRLGPFASISDTDFHVAGDREARADTAPVVLGRGVRLGSRVTVLRGAHIGDGAVVAAGSVVSGTVAAGARVSGVPARPVGLVADGPLDQGPTLDRIPAIFARALGLREVPGLQTARSDVPEWDSLGSLQVILALEEVFGVALDQEGLAGARTLADLAGLVEAGQARR